MSKKNLFNKKFNKSVLSINKRIESFFNFFKENFNFSVDAQLRDNCFENGQYHDSFIISLLEKEYRSF